MATSTQICTRALRRLAVIAADETPANADIDAANEALTAMINSWEVEGLTADAIPLDPRFEQGLVAMLAMRLAEEYGKTPSQVLVRDANDGWNGIKAAFFAVPASRFDKALKFTGHYSLHSYIIGDTDENYSKWKTATEYRLREYVTQNGMLYECITAGTSGTIGPTGTDAEIIDGTVTWCWRRVVGEP